jgi:acyl carrier protein
LGKKQKTMETKTMKRTLYKVLRKTGVHRDQIRLDASFKDDLNFDKLDWTLFVYYLEGLFKINLEDQEIRKLSYVNDTLEIVSRRTSSMYS